MNPPNGENLLDYLQRIAEAGERIADHLTKQSMKAESGTPPERKYVGQGQIKEPTDGNPKASSIRRPRQASRS